MSGVRLETQAKARLIAAAPELLEACQEQQIRLRDLFDRHERPTYSRDADSDLDLLLATGREAIRRALGVHLANDPVNAEQNLAGSENIISANKTKGSI